MLGSLPVLQLEVQDLVPFKATALDIGSSLGRVCAATDRVFVDDHPL